jgi:hypothetical protein
VQGPPPFNDDGPADPGGHRFCNLRIGDGALTCEERNGATMRLWTGSSG